MRILLLAIILFQTSAQKVSSQHKIEGKKATWSFNLASSFSYGGPGEKLDIFLDNSGYNWTLRTKNNSPFSFDLNRTLSNKLAVGISFSKYKQDVMWVLLGFRNSEFNNTIFNSYMSFNYKQLIFINAGPSLNYITFFHPTGTSLEDRAKYFKPGLIFKGLIKYPRKTRLFLQLEALYSYGGNISPSYNIENRTRQYTYTTLHPSDLPMNYFSVGAGIGIRFYRKTD